MIRDVVAASGLLSRSGSSPADLPAKPIVYIFDTVTLDGPDRLSYDAPPPAIARHQVRLELYAPREDDEAESALEKQLLLAGLLFTKSPREWVPAVQRYSVVYELSYTLKI